MDGRKCVPPIPGCKPSPTKVIPSFALGAAMRTSHARAKQSPAPMAGPLIAAIIGTGSFRTQRKSS
eukprot:6207121-Pleurochrysis_carterae.AAC.2